MSLALPGFFRTLGFDFSAGYLYIAPTDSADLASILAGTYNFTTVGAVTGTIVVATDEGTYSAGISLNAATTYDLYSQGVSSAHFGFLDTPIGYYISSSPLSDSEIAQAEAAFVAEGAAPRSDFGSVANFTEAFRELSTLTSFPLIDTSSGTNFYFTWFGCSSLTSFPSINTSSGTNFFATWYGCSSLTSFPLIDTSLGENFSSTWNTCSSLTSFPLIDTSSGTGFGNTWKGCSSLTSFPLINTSNGTNFGGTWRSCSSLTTFPANFFDSWSPASVSSGVLNLTWDGCSSLTAQSVENILTSLDTSGVYGTNTGASGGTQLADNTIDIDYDGTTLSSATTTAITNLKTKDWAISINSVIQ